MLNNKCFFVASADAVLCALLNSKVAWMQLVSLARIKRGGYIEAEAQYVGQLAIPDMPPATRDRLAEPAMKSSPLSAAAFSTSRRPRARS